MTVAVMVGGAVHTAVVPRVAVRPARGRVVGALDVLHRATAIAAASQELGLTDGRHLEDANLGSLFFCRAASKERRGPAEDPGALRSRRRH
eukprot:874082-Alexandrium_andersonii.AAC.1